MYLSPPPRITLQNFPLFFFSQIYHISHLSFLSWFFARLWAAAAAPSFVIKLFVDISSAELCACTAQERQAHREQEIIFYFSTPLSGRRTPGVFLEKKVIFFNKTFITQHCDKQQIFYNKNKNVIF